MSKATDFAEILEDEARDRLPISRSEIAALLRELEAENAQLREQNTMLEAKCAELEARAERLRLESEMRRFALLDEAQKVKKLSNCLAELRSKRVALSDEQIDRLGKAIGNGTLRNFARAIEAAHGFTGEAL